MVLTLAVILAWLAVFIIPTQLIISKGLHFGKNVPVSCKSEHLYQTIWIPGISLKAFRWGRVRYQYCPIGKHWSWTHQLDRKARTPEALLDASKVHDLRIL